MSEVNVPRSTDAFKLENNFYLINKKNVLAKITSNENAVKYKLYEKDAEQTLWIEIDTNPSDCGLIGSECNNRYDCQKAVDFYYICFFVSRDKAVCSICDLKKSIGNGVEVIQHLVDQWINSIRYVRSVCAFYSAEIESIFLSVVTRNYNEEGINRFISEYSNVEKNIDQANIPSFIQNSVKRNTRYIPGMLSILKSFVQKKIFFEKQFYDFRCIESADGEYTMKFASGILQC